MQLSLSEDLGFAVPFYAVHIHTALWDSLSRLVHSGIACLASQASNWLPFVRCPSKHIYCKTDCDWLPTVTAWMDSLIVKHLHTG